ncbi:MAG: FtsX-like permease family protein [Clostridium sp.]
MNKKIKSSSIFFVIAFTFAIFSFSLSASILESKRIANKSLNPDNSKILLFELETDVLIDELVNVVNNNDITISLSSFISSDKNESLLGYSLTTTLLKGKSTYSSDIISGRNLSDEELTGNDYLCVSTKKLSESDKIDILPLQNGTDKISLKQIGQVMNYSKTILVPNNIFFEYTGSNSLINGNFTVILQGEKSELNDSLSKIEGYIKKLSPNNKVSSYSPVISTPIESKFLIYISLIILVITILNSICISYLWVEDNKKELVIKKICGASSKKLSNLFFKELFYICIISMIIALGSHFILSAFTNNVVFGLRISLTPLSIVYTSVVTVLISYFTALPAFKYVFHLQPSEILKED